MREYKKAGKPDFGPHILNSCTDLRIPTQLSQIFKQTAIWKCVVPWVISEKNFFTDSSLNTTQKMFLREILTLSC